MFCPLIFNIFVRVFVLVVDRSTVSFLVSFEVPLGESYDQGWSHDYKQLLMYIYAITNCLEIEGIMTLSRQLLI